ncbi:hypothetical protein FRB90_009946, partial [Tulasnella sp. 427]
ILSIFGAIIFASCIYNPDYYSPEPPPPPLRVIAAIYSEHLQRSLDLGQNLLNLSRTYGFADIRRGYDVLGLERQVAPFSTDASSALLATKETLIRIINRAKSPAAYASFNINVIRDTIRNLLTKVKELHSGLDTVDKNSLTFEVGVNAGAGTPLAGIIAALSVEHLKRNLDLEQNLLNLSRTYGFADLRRRYDVKALERQVVPFSNNASGALIATDYVLKGIMQRAHSPAAYTSGNFNHIRERIYKLLLEVRELDEDIDAVDRQHPLIFEEEFNAAYALVPDELEDLGNFLKAASEHCEIIQDTGSTAMSILPSLVGSLGIVRPWFFLSAWAWERNLQVQERLRIYRSVKEVFHESFFHCEAVNLAEATLRRYLESYDLFRPYHYLLRMDDSKFPTIEESLAKASFYLNELESVAIIAGKAYEARFHHDTEIDM